MILSFKYLEAEPAQKLWLLEASPAPAAQHCIQLIIVTKIKEIGQFFLYFYSLDFVPVPVLNLSIAQKV
jgi:hypothetical protein